MIDYHLPIGSQKFLDMVREEAFRGMREHLITKVVLRLEFAFEHVDVVGDVVKKRGANVLGERHHDSYGCGYYINATWTTFVEKITEKISKFIENGSGWRLLNAKAMHISTTPYLQPSGDSYVMIPKYLSDKRCTINPENLKDNFCFAWCIAESTFPITHHRKH